MKVVFFVVLGIIALIILLSIPIKAKTYFVLDYATKSLFFSMRIGSFNMACGKIMVLGDYSVTRVTKASKILKMPQPKMETYYFVTKLFSLLRFKQLIFMLELGIMDDAFTSAMIIASLKAFLSGLVAGTKKSVKSYAITFNQVMGENQVNVTASTKITVNALKVLYALIYSKLKFKKIKGENKQYAKAN